MAARILLLVALVALVTANPSNVASKGCEWDIRGGNSIMGVMPSEDTMRTAKVQGVECSGELTIGTEYTVELTGKSMGEQYVLQVSGTASGDFASKLSSGGNTCARRTDSSSPKITFTGAGTAEFDYTAASGRGTPVKYSSRNCQYTVKEATGGTTGGTTGGATADGATADGTTADGSTSAAARTGLFVPFMALVMASIVLAMSRH